MARIPYASTGLPGPGNINIFRMLANAPSLLPLLAQQGQTQYTALALTTRLRELVILYSSLRFESAYEHQQHLEISKPYVTDAQRAEIEKTAGDATFFLNGKGKEGVFVAQELAMLKFLEATVNSPIVNDAIFDEAKKYLSDRQLVEIVIVQGYYYELARITTVFGVDVDEMPQQGSQMHEKVDDEHA